MMKVYPLVIALLANLVVGAFAQQPLKDYDLEYFNKIKISNAIDVVIEQTGNSRVEVTAPKNIIDEIEVYVSDEQLTISRKSNKIVRNSIDILVYIECADIRDIILSGASDLESKGVLRLDNLSVKASGASDSWLHVEATSIDIELSGASDMKLKGKTYSLSVENSGASDLEADQLEATLVNIESSGASDSKIWVKEFFEANASGSSSVFFKGDPPKVTINASISSEIEPF